MTMAKFVMYATETDLYRIDIKRNAKFSFKGGSVYMAFNEAAFKFEAFPWSCVEFIDMSFYTAGDAFNYNFDIKEDSDVLIKNCTYKKLKSFDNLSSILSLQIQGNLSIIDCNFCDLYDLNKSLQTYVYGFSCQVHGVCVIFVNYLSICNVLGSESH